MAHIVILGLVVTLVAGVMCFAVLVRKIHGRLTRLPPSIPTPLLLYNLWIATWLVSQYFRFYLYPTLSRPVGQRIEMACTCAGTLLALAWLRAQVALVDEFLRSHASHAVRRGVAWLAWTSAAVLLAGSAVSLLSPALRWLSLVPVAVVEIVLFPIALGASVLLAVGARREPHDGVRQALAVLGRSYVVLFCALTFLMLVAWPLQIATPAVLLAVDLALELAYNVLTVIWVGRYADAFADAAPSEADMARTFDTLCESYGISKREREVIELICQGLTNQEIANRLFISPGTVKDHNYTIFQKVGVRNRTRLAQVFTRPAGSQQAPAVSHPSSGIRRVI